MKSVFLAAALVLVSSAVKAQDVTYEKLDSVSQYINRMQLAANDKSYVANNQTIKVSFSRQNFRLFYNDFLATHVVYKSKDGGEIMELAEKIDLADVKTITLLSDYNRLYVYRLTFPASRIAVQVYEEGKFTGVKKVSEIDLYATGDKWAFYNEVVKLCETLQNRKNKNGYNVAVMSRDWLDAKARNTVTGYQTFCSKYPASLYIPVTKTLLEAQKKQLEEEKERLEKIRLENVRIQEEKDRQEKERLAIIAEAARVKAERNIGFFSVRAGYVIPTHEDSKKVSGTPSVILNSAAASPYTTGAFGLKPGFSVGLNGIINLEFINKNLPSWVGVGVPVDVTVAMMQYNWDAINTNTTNSYVYQNAKYGLWGAASAGAGLSVTFHPCKKTFIDIIARPDFYGTFGGNYKANATNGSGNFTIKTERGSGSTGDSFSWAKTIGLSVRYKKVLLGFELKDGIADKAEFTERIENTGSYTIKNAGLNLNYMQFAFGYIF